MDATSLSKNKITLVSSEGRAFEVDEGDVKSNTIKLMIEDTGNVDPIPLLNVDSNTLTKVIEYSKFHAASDARLGDAANDAKQIEDDANAWDAEFVKVDLASLVDMILAANYLDIKPLLGVTCQAVAMMIRGRTPEEIRDMFKIENDFTAEEEEEVRRENQWAFQ
jgi:S-phase kinase-associated protein 1